MDQILMKTRLFVMTDFSTITADSGEPDDTQSLVRLLLYAHQFAIEGLVATYTDHDTLVRPEYLRAMIGAYAKVRDNLLLHQPDYPTADLLLAQVKAGLADGKAFGEGMDSDVFTGTGYVFPLGNT